MIKKHVTFKDLCLFKIFLNDHQGFPFQMKLEANGLCRWRQSGREAPILVPKDQI